MKTLNSQQSMCLVLATKSFIHSKSLSFLSPLLVFLFHILIIKLRLSCFALATKVIGIQLAQCIEEQFQLLLIKMQIRKINQKYSNSSCFQKSSLKRIYYSCLFKNTRQIFQTFSRDFEALRERKTQPSVSKGRPFVCVVMRPMLFQHRKKLKNYGKCMGFPINFPICGKVQQNPWHVESLGN